MKQVNKEKYIKNYTSIHYLSILNLLITINLMITIVNRRLKDVVDKRSRAIERITF